MSVALCAAEVNYENDNNEKKNNNKPVGMQRKNQTYKNKDTAKKIKKEQIEHIYTEQDDDSPLADFTPVQTYLQKQHTQQQQHGQNEFGYINNPDTTVNPRQNSPSIREDRPIPPEAFSQLESTYSKDYYKQYKYPGSYVASQPSIDSQSELLKKLDNILFLLEEQQEDKTNLITEELILYVFLGVFVIYVLDSFVRVGKYVR